MKSIYKWYCQAIPLTEYHSTKSSSNELLKKPTPSNQANQRTPKHHHLPSDVGKCEGFPRKKTLLEYHHWNLALTLA